jgi:hypothetical protein
MVSEGWSRDYKNIKFHVITLHQVINHCIASALETSLHNDDSSNPLHKTHNPNYDVVQKHAMTLI